MRIRETIDRGRAIKPDNAGLLNRANGCARSTVPRQCERYGASGRGRRRVLVIASQPHGTLANAAAPRGLFGIGASGVSKASNLFDSRERAEMKAATLVRTALRGRGRQLRDPHV